MKKHLFSLVREQMLFILDENEEKRFVQLHRQAGSSSRLFIAAYVSALLFTLH
jgi:hypothetical protein